MAEEAALAHKEEHAPLSVLLGEVRLASDHTSMLRSQGVAPLAVYTKAF